MYGDNQSRGLNLFKNSLCICGQFDNYDLIHFQLTIEKELQNAQDRISNLHEGIGTTNSNYEEQISMLSEHVANMNEKLAEKTEEIQVF